MPLPRCSSACGGHRSGGGRRPCLIVAAVQQQRLLVGRACGGHRSDGGRQPCLIIAAVQRQRLLVGRACVRGRRGGELWVSGGWCLLLRLALIALAPHLGIIVSLLLRPALVLKLAKHQPGIRHASVFGKHIGGGAAVGSSVAKPQRVRSRRRHPTRLPSSVRSSILLFLGALPVIKLERSRVAQLSRHAKSPCGQKCG